MKARTPKKKAAKPTKLIFDANEALEIEKNKKTDEEIDKLKLPDNLSQSDRALLLLDSENEQQRDSVLQTFPRFLQICIDEDSRMLPSQQIADELSNTKKLGRSCIGPILQKLLKDIEKSTPERRASAGAILATAIPILAAASNDLLDTILVPFILTMIDIDEGGIALGWIEPLIIAIPFASVGNLHRICAVALCKYDVSKKASERLIASNLIGKLTTCLQGDIIEQKLLRPSLLLSQDIESGVRMSIARHMGNIYRKLKSDNAKEQVLTELEQLMNDEETEVKVEALTSIVQIIEGIPKHRIGHILHLVHSITRETEPPLLVATMAELIGPLLDNLDKTSATTPDYENTKSRFIEYFKSLDSHNLPEIRKLCAYNIPAVAKSVGKYGFGSQLASTFVALAGDSEDEVRKTIAAGFHEIATILGSDLAESNLKNVMMTLMADSRVDVTAKLVEHFDVTLPKLLSPIKNSPRKTKKVKDTSNIQLVSQIVEYNNKLAQKWREAEVLYKQMPAICSRIDAQVLYEQLRPLLIMRMHNDITPVKQAAAEAFCEILRTNPQVDSRFDMSHQIYSEFAQSGKSPDRMLFLHICEILRGKFSKKWFKDHIVETCLTLCQDPVPNVRLKLAKLLPSLCDLVSSHVDAALGSNLSIVASRLAADSDSDVSRAGKEAEEAVSKSKEKQSIASKSSSAASDKLISEADKADRIKEAEEESVFRNDCNINAEPQRIIAENGNSKPSTKKKKTVTTPAGTSSSIPTKANRGSISTSGRLSKPKQETISTKRSSGSMKNSSKTK